ncbi:MAG: cyclic 2,3-diphosphoglycerate synthase [Breznakibacter sp.]
MKRVVIIGAAGRDFHNFNTYFRGNKDFEVVAFTAAQIPDIDNRSYPAELAGELYPQGIPILAEEHLPDLIKRMEVDICVFSYSDVPYQKVMNLSALVNSAGASFLMLGPHQTQIKSTKPVISVCATRTGCGKSQTSRKVVEILMKLGLKVVAIRHPMPYGDLNKQKVQRFAAISDLAKHQCTIEEMEEYEPHIVRGNVIYAGVDYEAILREAEKDPDGCDVILWDGGNNDFSFYQTDLLITVVDPHRVGHELSYYPGEVNLRMADVVIINKVDSANHADVEQLKKNIASVNSKAVVIPCNSPIRVDHPELIDGKRVLVVEDGPTLTHGEMKLGAALLAARQYNAKTIVDPRPYLAGKLKATFATYPNIGHLLPAMGYGDEQIRDLKQTIDNTVCDTVIIGTPIDLSRIFTIGKNHTRVHYDLDEIGGNRLDEIIKDFVETHLG